MHFDISKKENVHFLCVCVFLISFYFVIYAYAQTFLFEFLNGYSVCRKKNKERIPQNRKIVLNRFFSFLSTMHIKCFFALSNELYLSMFKPDQGRHSALYIYFIY